MNQEIVRQLTTNAQISKAVFTDFLARQKNAKFLENFHLRPTSVGVTIVSTLPYAPMRGISIPSTSLATEFTRTLETLAGNFGKLMGEDEQAAKEILRTMGFKERQSAGANGDREEDVQAAFIRGIIAKEPDYEGIQFVASELNLEDNNRFDVVGVKDDCLYLFELKNGRTTAVFEQVSRYLAHVQENWDVFTALLQCYPNLTAPIAQIQDIKGIAVMRYAHNSPASTWKTLIRKHDVDVWFFRQSITFEKLSR